MFEFLSVVGNLLFCLYFTPTNTFNASRIVGGRVCKVTQYPFVVSLINEGGGGSCGGSLLAFHWVLTAGHCIRLDKIEHGQTKIRSGFNSSTRYVQTRTVKKAYVHEKYSLDLMEADNPELRYDIALVLLEKPFFKSVTCNLAALPKPGFTAKCKIGKALGIGKEEVSYGRRSFLKTDIKDKPLKCVDLHIVDADTCKKTYPTSVIDDKLICTAEKVIGKDACQGDSGGPLLCKGNDNVVIGIVSFGKGCALPDMAATYSRVESFLDFINKTMSKHSGGASNKIWILLHAIHVWCLCF